MEERDRRTERKSCTSFLVVARLAGISVPTILSFAHLRFIHLTNWLRYYSDRKNLRGSPPESSSRSLAHKRRASFVYDRHIFYLPFQNAQAKTCPQRWVDTVAGGGGNLHTRAMQAAKFAFKSGA